MLHQCTDAPFPCPLHTHSHSLCSAQAQILLVDIFLEQHHHYKCCLDVVAAAWTHSSHFKWICCDCAQHCVKVCVAVSSLCTNQTCCVSAGSSCSAVGIYHEAFLKCFLWLYQIVVATVASVLWFIFIVCHETSWKGKDGFLEHGITDFMQADIK